MFSLMWLSVMEGGLLTMNPNTDETQPSLSFGHGAER